MRRRADYQATTRWTTAAPGPTMDRPLLPKRGSCVSATTIARPSPTVTPTPAASGRRRAALLFALRLYLRELRSHPLLATGELLCPALGNVCLGYLPPLVVAALVGALATGTSLTVQLVTPHLFAFAGALVAGELFWRLGIHCLNRTDAYGIERLSISGMDALLAKDADFFHPNFAGSLTKRVLTYASEYEDFVDTLAFQIVANLVPLVFASVVLWQYDPLLVVVLLGIIALTGVAVTPLIRRRQALVDEREASWARLSGHVADTLTNMDAVRAYASERREAAEHRRRVGDHRKLTLLTWDYHNLRIDTLVAPLSVVANVAGLALAVVVASRMGPAGVAAVVVTFAYYVQATKILFDFNQIYRQLERTLTEAAQFAELLLDPPTVLDPESPEPVAYAGAGVVLEDVRFTHAGDTSPLFEGLNLRI